MSLESAIEQLASAVRSQGDSAAVAEIMNQRDRYKRQMESALLDVERYCRLYRESGESRNRMARQINALRGVITRMKGKRNAD